MRHRNLNTKLSRTASHRKATVMNIMRGLFNHERVVTTLTKAKVTSKWADKVITFAKKNNLAAIRKVESIFQDRALVSRIFKEIGPKFENRQGGYTRVVKVSRRRGDGTVMAILELTHKDVVETPVAVHKVSAEQAKGADKVSASEPAKSEAQAEVKTDSLEQPEEKIQEEPASEDKE